MRTAFPPAPPRPGTPVPDDRRDDRAPGTAPDAERIGAPEVPATPPGKAAPRAEARPAAAAARTRVSRGMVAAVGLAALVAGLVVAFGWFRTGSF
ncbi:MAG: hypothetical protein M5U14_13710 [Acidimicrobiia bacterium]|nr:hypothetical protein [Acidimicrobiia bacterium]